MSVRSRFEAKVRRTETCWLWTGAVSKRGYGMFRHGGRGSLTGHAHRMAWILALFIGTAADNAADCVAKDRQNKGVKHPRAKLTDADVLERCIRLRKN